VDRSATTTAALDPGFSYAVGIGGVYDGGAVVGGFTGTLDEVGFYASAFSAARVAIHYNAFLGWAGDLSGARVTKVLDAVGWPAADRDLDTGSSTLQATGLGGSALAHLQAVDSTENGALYMTADGKVRFRDRHAALVDTVMTTSQATFADDGSALQFVDTSPDHAVDLIANVVRIGRAGGTVQEASDAASIATYFRRVLERTSQLNSTDAESRDAAAWLLAHRKDQALRYGRLVVEPYGYEATLLPQIFGRLIGDRITVTQTPPGGGAANTIDMIIEGVAIEASDAFALRCTWSLSPAETQDYWVIGDSSNGVLGSSTRLAY
jgi:hypothetical protein